MDQNRRDSDLSSEIYFSLYGNNRKLKPQRIKSYAVYKSPVENTKIVNNLVIASNETNEISVSFNGGSDCKVFTFDKVFYSNDSQDELSDSLHNSAIQDVIMGLNSFLIVYPFSFPCATRTFQENMSSDMSSVDAISASLMKELLCFVKKEENIDSSIHVSHFEVHSDRLIDLLSECCEYKDMKVFDVSEQSYIGVKDLVEKPLVDVKDIDDFFIKQQSHNLVCSADCCRSVLSISLVKKNINSEGFEFIKVGKLTVVSSAKCKNNFLGNVSKTPEDYLLKFLENCELPTSSKSTLFNILKPAFGGNAKTIIIVYLSSVLYSLDKDLSVLQFISEAGKILTYPEIDLQLIIPNSIKEYAEEVKELQKDFDATCRAIGVQLDNLSYWQNLKEQHKQVTCEKDFCQTVWQNPSCSSFKNSLSLESEKAKSLNSQLLSLTDAVNSKKQLLISIHASNELKENEIREVEKSTADLESQLEKIKIENNAIQQKTSSKADEIISMKKMKFFKELSKKKLKLQLAETNRNFEQLAQSLPVLKNEMVSFLCDIDAQHTSLRSTLELLIVDMKNTLSDFHNLQEDLTVKLNDLCDIDAFITMWKQNTENMISKFSSFIDEYNRNLNVLEFEISMSPVPFYTCQNEILEVIRSSRNEKWPVLSYYFGKAQIFCDSSFKILAEIMHQLDVIQSCYKAELKALEAALSSSSHAFKKFVSDISTTLKSFQQYFEGQEKELLGMTNIICFHHQFKKLFDEKFSDIKQSLMTLKCIYVEHNEAAVKKWNEIKKESSKTLQKHVDLSEHLTTIQKEMSKYVDNVAQQKLNTLEYSPLKDKTDIVESRAHQLLQIHKEMKADIGEANEVHRKSLDKELKEVKDYMKAQNSEVQKYFDTCSSKLKANSNYFHDELKTIQQYFSSNKDEQDKDLATLVSSLNDLETIVNNYPIVSNSILEKSGRSFKIMPPDNEDKNHSILDFENLILDEWNVVTSTPNVPCKKEFNTSLEKEKLMFRIKSVVEQQVSDEQIICELDYEGKEMKSNMSTMSLPNLSSKVPVMFGKKFSRSTKK